MCAAEVIPLANTRTTVIALTIIHNSILKMIFIVSPPRIIITNGKEKKLIEV